MVERKNLLTVREASYCLNVSERLIYDWLAEGRLIALKERPIRIRAAEIKAMMHNFDE
ncbi:MAG: helix-turn-helix domain-containing protein [Desulfovibrionaceae bacterium]|nr:helix-turn-helix domain-containing protein [Desulfovibrionaceae bacterium]